MKSRLIVLVAILLILTLVACSLADLLPGRQSQITATPTRTPKPTFTATNTGTPTLVPSATPTPTNTSTPTPIPTDTPIPSDTPTPTLTPTITDTPPPTDTPTVTPKPTSKPKPRPTKTPIPKPTNPPPPPFTGQITGGARHCSGFTAVQGFVKHANGAPFVGVSVGVWSDAWQGRVSGASEANGKYDVSLGGVPPGKFYVAVVKLETCSSRDGAPTANECQLRSNVITVTTTEGCTGNNDVQVPEVTFTGP